VLCFALFSKSIGTLAATLLQIWAKERRKSVGKTPPVQWPCQVK